LNILLGAVVCVLLLILLMTIVVEPWVGKKMETVFNKNAGDYLLKISKVHISIIHAGIELENISLNSKQEHGGQPDLTGKISSVKFKGINLWKALTKKDIVVREVSISDSRITGKVTFPQKTRSPKVSSLNIRINSLFFDKLDLAIKSTSTVQAYSIKEGFFKVYDLHVEKLDTLSPGIVRQFDLDVQEFITVLPDSMYTITSRGINYSATSNTLEVDSFSIHPNYANYEFTDRHQFENDRVEANLSQISFRGFSAGDYIKSGNLISSFVEIGEMDLNVFRDKRKEFRHVNKPAFQDMIYNYPGMINIDSIGILSGNMTYAEHAEKANEPGIICFNKINVHLYKITNDTIYKTGKASLKLKGDALLMGEGRLTFLLEAGIFDRQNTFSVKGNLSGMEASELNPMLEKNAFLYATSGKIDEMNFSFIANNTKATGKMTLLYHGLNIAIKNKQTDKTTAIKERIQSVIANLKMIDANPKPGEEVREGIIDFERDPEKFLFNYCFKSMLSGIESSITDRSLGKKK
jgi:hypothetical protein